MKKRVKQTSVKSAKNSIAPHYDTLYKWKDYTTEAQAIDELIAQLRDMPAVTLLDAGCRTGKHSQALSDHFRVVGIEENKELLDIAKKQYPRIEFISSPVHNFSIPQKFDAIICLFGAINTCRTLKQLDSAMKHFSDHLTPGGVLILEPLFTTDTFKPGTPHTIHVEHEGTHIHRVHVPKAKGANTVILEFHYIITDNNGVTTFRDTRQLGMFSIQQYLGACHKKGIEATYLDQGLAESRGLIVGVKRNQ